MMKNRPHSHQSIPLSIKIFSWILILAGIFFFYVFTFNPGLSFPGASITDYSSQLGFSSTGVRVLGSVIALLISVIFNKPQWLFITLISRLVIETGDIIVNVVTHGTIINTMLIGLIAVLEFWAVIKLYRITKTQIPD